MTNKSFRDLLTENSSIQVLPCEHLRNGSMFFCFVCDVCIRNEATCHNHLLKRNHLMAVASKMMSSDQNENLKFADKIRQFVQGEFPFNDF